MCTVQSRCLSLCLLPELCCINMRALHCHTITMEFLLWVFFFFPLFFTRRCWKPNVPDLLKDKIKLKSQVVCMWGVCPLCVCVCETFTCRYVCRNGAQTPGGHGEACVSLTVSSWGDLVILVCEEEERKKNSLNHNTWSHCFIRSSQLILIEKNCKNTLRSCWCHKNTHTQTLTSCTWKLHATLPWS